MSVRVEERPTRWLNLSIVGAVLAAVMFGTLFASQRDWVAGGFALISLIGAAWTTALWLRLRRRRRPTSDLASPNYVPPRRAFTSRARDFVGARYRDGHVVIGEHAAAFVPSSSWRHVVLEMVIGLLASPMSLSEIQIEALDSHELADELAALARHRGGYVIDTGWAWARRGYALALPGGCGYLTIEDTPPLVCVERWADLPVDPGAVRRRIIKVLIAGGASVAVLFVAGVAAWQITGNPDFMIAGSSYAGLILVSVVIGMVLARRGKTRSS